MPSEDLVPPVGDDSGPLSTAPTSVERLRRRLDRERRARREAEEISERATRELYERQAELVLLEMVAVASNEATTLLHAIVVAIDGVCEHTGWPVGHAYLRSEEDPEVLVPSGIWHLEDERRFDNLRRVTERMRLAYGVGLPGRVLASGQPVWISDVTADPNFPRAKQARDIGVRAAFAFPVLVGSEVAAVLEFFSPETAAPNEALLARLAHIGSQLGRVIERRRAADERERLRRRMEVLLESAGEGIYGIDLQGKTTFVNPAAGRLLGWPAEDLIGRYLHEVVHGSRSRGDGHDRSCCPLTLPRAAGLGRAADCDVFRRRDGTSFEVEYISTPLREHGRVTGAVVTFKDVTERRRFELQLQHLADHDALTGLINRRRFEQELERAVAHCRRYGTGAAALLLDLDSFKLVNDALGHHAGDELIRGVAGLLRARLRDTDVLARIGGDEFAVLLPNGDRADVERVAGQLLDVVRRQSVGVGGTPMHVSTSIGVALLDDEALTGEELLVRADVAMYAAKEAGRDRFVTYTGELGKARMGGGLSSERIRRALAEDRFALYYQPIVNLATDEVTQIEVLLRMEDDAGEILLPGSFLPTAERFGLMQDIDRWVVQAAVGLLAEGGVARGLELLVEINLSGRSVGDPELPSFIERLLSETRVNPANLIFEVTETAAVANMEEARAFAERLSGLGCRFALDDFGAGFGSFYYLKYLPLAYLKIDGDFIRSLPRSRIDQRVVRAMVDVARGLRLKTIAEFVGDDETLELLRRYGVDYAQGYHVGRPRPVETLRDSPRWSEGGNARPHRGGVPTRNSRPTRRRGS